MKRKNLSQEMLKGIACAAMLIDHIGAVLIPGDLFRIIGRVSFPVFCFLIAEGVRHTRRPGRYALRLGIGVLLAELPFDYLFFGGLDWQHQNVMFTLLIGMAAGYGMLRLKGLSFLPPVAGYLLAEWIRADYGGVGVLLICLFLLTAEDPRRNLLMTICMAVTFLLMNSYRVHIFGIPVPIQLFGLLSMVPISMYSGKKALAGKWAQRSFYLFYPIHMLILLAIRTVLS